MLQQGSCFPPTPSCNSLVWALRVPHPGTFRYVARCSRMWTPRPFMLTSCSLACAIAIAFFAGGHGSVAIAAEGSSVGNGEGGYVPDFVAPLFAATMPAAKLSASREHANQRAPCFSASAMSASSVTPHSCSTPAMTSRKT